MEEKGKILIIEDNAPYARYLGNWLRPHGYEVETACHSASAKKMLGGENTYVCVLADIRLPDGDGVEILAWMRKRGIAIPYIVMTQNEDVTSAVKAMKLGAKDYLPKKMIDEHSLLKTIQDAIGETKRRKAVIYKRNSHAYTVMMKKVKMVSAISISVLITGENGSGKEHVAQAIHEHGNRSSKPFIAVDCGTLPKELSASALFGHKRGAFTGATEDKVGFFGQANGGTLFLDEIGNLSMEAQVMLLRALQEQTYRPVGSERDEHCNVRVIAATNEDLKKAIEEGRFRQDLYYRLNEFDIHLPPLRDCPDDILPLAEFFKESFHEETECEAGGFTEEAKRLLLSYSWPGNVRELRNCIRKAVLMADGGEITPDLLELDVSLKNQNNPLTLKNGWEERQRILAALERARWNKSKAAELLGISRPTIYEKIEKYDLGKL